MKYEAKLLVEAAEEFQALCREPDSSCGEGEVLFDREVAFVNGYSMAIQVIADDSPDEFPAWTQGVLYDQDRNELASTEVGAELLGKFTIEYDDDEFEVEVTS